MKSVLSVLVFSISTSRCLSIAFGNRGFRVVAHRICGVENKSRDNHLDAPGRIHRRCPSYVDTPGLPKAAGEIVFYTGCKRLKFRPPDFGDFFLIPICIESSYLFPET
jgi:hypothetical protein